MNSRIEELQVLRDLTRGAGAGSAHLTISELEDLLAAIEAAQAMMRDHHAFSPQPGRLCIDVPTDAFCEFAAKLAHLTHNPCDKDATDA